MMCPTLSFPIILQKWMITNLYERQNAACTTNLQVELTTGTKNRFRKMNRTKPGFGLDFNKEVNSMNN